MMTRSPENTFLVPSIIIIPTDICQILDLFILSPIQTFSVLANMAGRINVPGCPPPSLQIDAQARNYLLIKFARSKFKRWIYILTAIHCAPPSPGENFLFPLASSCAICRSKFRQETRDYDLFPSKRRERQTMKSKLHFLSLSLSLAYYYYICIFYAKRDIESIETNSVVEKTWTERC